MSTATIDSTTTAPLTATLYSRLLDEGYGPGAWHGPDMKAAIDGVSQETAFRRPGPDRHNIAEIVLHHAWCVRSVAGQLSGKEPEPFVLEGSDWFALSSKKDLAWSRITGVLDEQQQRLAKIVADIAAGRAKSPLSETEQLGLVLGVTCHAVYHAGQIQLIKVLAAA